MKKDRLDAKLKEDGVFWEPSKPDEKITGKVEFDGKHIDFATSPEFASLDMEDIRVLFGQIGQNSSIDPLPVLFGYLGGSPCTLLHLHPLNDGGFTDLGRMQGVSYKQYRVSLCILGIHLGRLCTSSASTA